MNNSPLAVFGKKVKEKIGHPFFPIVRGDLWQKRDQKHRPPCPGKKRDSPVNSLSFLGIVIAAQLHLQ